MKILAASDIHGDSNALGMIGNIALRQKPDVILLAGDICANCRYRRFVDLLPELTDHARCPVIMTPGNHDFWNTAPFRPGTLGLRYQKGREPIVEGKNEIGKKAIVCLVDEAITFMGYKIFGAPWTPTYGHWAWMKDVSELTFDVPDDTDILLTHCPPFGHGDQTSDGRRLGSEALTETINKNKNLTLAIYGHVHEDGGWAGKINETILRNVSCRDKNHNLKLQGMAIINIPEKNKDFQDRME